MNNDSRRNMLERFDVFKEKFYPHMDINGRFILQNH